MITCKSCGAILPDGATTCSDCGTRINYVTQDVQNLPYVPKTAKFAKRTKLDWVALVVGCIGLVMTIVGMFLPYVTETYNKKEWITDYVNLQRESTTTTITENYSVWSDGFIEIVICAVLIIVSLSFHIATHRGNGIGQIIVGALFMGFIFKCYTITRDVVTDSTTQYGAVLGRSSASMWDTGIGFIMILVGGVLIMLSGILSLVSKTLKPNTIEIS